MASQPYHSPSTKSRFGRGGFHPLHPDQQANMDLNDATIDIPLEQVPSQASGSGLRPLHTGASLLQTASKTSNKSKPYFRGRRARPEVRKEGKDGEEYKVTAMGKIYDKIFGFSIVTRYFLYVLPLGIILAVPILVGAIIENTSAETPKLAGVPLVWFFTWIEVVWLSLWVSKIVAHFLPFLFQTFVGVVSSGVRKYATVIRKLEIPLSLVGWALTSLATFLPIMTQNPYQSKMHTIWVANRKNGADPSAKQDWEGIVQNILAACLVSSLVFLGEKLIIQLISINYHRKQFDGRIRESKRHVYLLGLMYDASRQLFPMYCNEFAEEDYIIANQLAIAALGGKVQSHRRTGSSTPMRLIQNVGRIGDKVTSAFGNVAQEITGKEVFNPTSAHSIVVEALEKKRTSEALARRIWMSLVVDGRESLLQEDLLDVFGPGRTEEAEEAFWLLDQDGNGDVSLDEMCMTVAEFSKERKAISNSMTDVAQAINVLDRLLLAVVLVAVVFIFVAFLNSKFTTTLATTGTALLSLSFVFSATAQEVLGSCIFLFVKHPFDIFDRVDIKGDNLVVEHISLLYSVFRRVNGPMTGQLVQYPNIVLNTYPIENVSRSKAMTEQITLDVSFNTTFEDVQILKNELKNFVTDKENSRDFQPDLDVDVLGTADMTRLQLKIEIRHKSNWSNETLRAARRSKFMCALIAALRRVPIYYPGGGYDLAGSAANPNRVITTTEDEAVEHAKIAAEAREKARLVPTQKIEEAKEELPSPSAAPKIGPLGVTSRETKILEELTAEEQGIDRRGEAWASGRDDSDTLASRSDIDRQDIEGVRGLLRRESTRGKRKPGMDANMLQRQTSIVPTIYEPGSPSLAPYDSRQGPYGSIQQVYRSPTVRTQQSPQYGAAMHAAGSSEMSPIALEGTYPMARPVGSTGAPATRISSLPGRPGGSASGPANPGLAEVEEEDHPGQPKSASRI